MRQYSILGFFCLLSACGGPESRDAGDRASDPGEVGEATFEITTVPAGTLCVQIDATGSTTVSKQFTVSAGASSASLAMGQLPLGSVALTGQAYNVACASTAGVTPTWIADPAVISVQTGVISTVTLTFRPYNATVASANFVGNVVQLSPGSPTYALMGDGTVRAAGTVPYLLGSNTFAPVPSLANVKQLSISSQFGCEVLNTGALQCWGDNSQGQLGTNGAQGSSATPIAVPGMSNVVQVATGYGHACARTSNGYLYCWGQNDSGQVGTGTTGNVLSPVLVAAQASSVVTTGYSTCAILVSSLYCWGMNTDGQTGVGNTLPVKTPTWVSGVTAPQQVVVGYRHACALRADGTVKCWGYAGSGQLGNGGTSASSTPVAVPGLTGVKQLAGNDLGTCARTATGVWCWGDNGYGQMGDGLGANRLSPFQLTSVGAPASLVGGGNDFCAIASNNSIQCWGGNDSFQLGTGSTASAFVPIPINL